MNPPADEATLDAMLASASLIRVAKPSGGSEAEPWILECKPVGDGPPMAQRMKAVLKRMLRDHGVKVTVVRSPGPEDRP
jgi:hypothetical protein